MTRVVVTGASGNIGTAVLMRLGPRDDVDLVGVSRRQPPPVPPYSWADWVDIDVAHEGAPSALAHVFAGADVVVHLAWAIQPNRQRELMRRVNQDGSCAVAEAARRAGVRQLVHMSSIGAYAPAPNQVVTESWPTSGIPTSHYSVDKAAVEAMLAHYEADLDIAVVRPTLVLQPAAASEVTRYFIGRLIPARLLNRSSLRFVPFPSSLSLQFVHADDVSAAIETLIDAHATGAYNVAAPPTIDRECWRELFGGVGPDVRPRLLRALASATWHSRLQPTDAGWLDLALGAPLLDTTKLRDLGWQAARFGSGVLLDFVDALSRGAGRPGPLLHARSDARPGPAKHVARSDARTNAT